MNRILITGATGNIGTEVINYLFELNFAAEVIAGVRSEESAKKNFLNFPRLKFRRFDFEDVKTFETSFEDVELLFLLRPPQISDIEKYFGPLLVAAQEKGIKDIVFLSVQGAEKSKVIPHNKIECLIKSMGFNYIFVRPSYFMQNLTTTLRSEIVENKTITLPAGNAKFNWVDVKDIGEVVARVIVMFEKYKNKAYEITGTENKSFLEVSQIMSGITGVQFSYQNINPISFYFKKRKEGMQSDFAIVMTILHFLPRLQKQPDISDNFKKITGKTPTKIAEFLTREKENLLGG